jgi:hypothetical protein
VGIAFWSAIRTAAVVGASAALLAGCGLFGSDSPGKETSAFDVKVGDCLTPPEALKAEVSKLTILPCTVGHTQEAYAVVDYSTAADAKLEKAATYPGSDVLTTFANSTCAQRYADYVGVPYTDSSLFFTFLLPSARSWESGDDRTVICFVTTTGQQLTASVKNSKR